MGSSLDQLPQELLIQIFIHLGTARTLLHLSLTCKRIHAIVEKDGFRIFVQSHFPSFQIPPYWKDAAHAMTTLSRNWDRKSFIAQLLLPNEYINSPRGYSSDTKRQSMGYQPVIDSYDEWLGGNWSSRRQVVAWAAGSDLILRVKLMGDGANWTPEDVCVSRQKEVMMDQHHHIYKWNTFRDHQYKAGKDDIRSVNVLRSMQRPEEKLEHVIVGRASGALNLVALSVLNATSVTKSEFDTGARSIRDATINEAANPLLAVCLSARDLALYHVRSEDEVVKAIDETSAISSTERGLGPSKTPIHVYDIQPDGFSDQPIRKFGLDLGDLQGVEAGCGISSVYPIVPITPAAVAGGAKGDIFLSGGHDGNIRLHDLRSPASSTAIFTDPVDSFSSIYSLVSFGRERFLAGGSRHSIIKVFDFRMPGGKVYYAADLEPCSSNDNAPIPISSAHGAKHPVCCQYHLDMRCNRRNYNIFINSPSSTGRQLGYGPRGQRHESPVYSLSSPSPCSPTVFAGIENNVLQFDVISVMDRNPDPLYQTRRQRKRSENSVMKKWDPHSNVIQLALYEHHTGNVNLNVQQKVDQAIGLRKGWDERWV